MRKLKPREGNDLSKVIPPVNDKAVIYMDRKVNRSIFYSAAALLLKALAWCKHACKQASTLSYTVLPVTAEAHISAVHLWNKKQKNMRHGFVNNSLFFWILTSVWS